MNQNNNGQRNGQNNLGNNRTVQNPNQGVPGGSQNGSSFLNDTPSTGTTPRREPNGGGRAPAHSSSSFQDSLNRKPNSSFKDDEKSKAIDKAANFIPGVGQAKKLADLSKKANNALNNIRANKGPQLPPGNGNGGADNGNRRNNGTIPRDGNGFGRPSLLPRRRSLLDRDEHDDEGENEEEPSGISSLTVRQKRNNNSGSGFSFLARGFLRMSPILKLILIVIVAMFFFMLLFMIIISPIISVGSISAIGIADNNEEYKTSGEEKKFQDRVNEVKSEYSSDGKNFEAKYIGAVFTILSTYGKGYSYKKMTKAKIEEIADLMFDENNSFSEDTFKNNLIKNYFPSKIPGKTEEVYKKYVDDMYELLKYYDDETKKSNTNTANGVTGAVCTYTFPGINAEQYGTGIKNRSINATNIMVRLMSAGGICDGTYGVPIEGEELVPLEKYALGVAYAEIGESSPEQAFKTQVIAARSFALAVPDASGNTGGRKLYEENGQWILQISNCVTDQVYCDPDRGCSVNGSSSNQNLVMHSGTDTASTKHFDPLPADAPQRQWAAEVAGKVALDSSGNLYQTNFLNTDQNAWISMAKQGMDYTEIIMKHYPNVASISESNCVDSSSSAASGNYVAWKQTDSQWSSIVLGGGTDQSRSIGKIGCLATSISMLIAKSGAVDSITNSDLKANFNPGTFVEAMNKVGGFDSGGNLQWYKVSSVAPSFSYSGTTNLSGLTKDEKLKTIKEKTSQTNTYCVLEVKGGQGQHWVAVDSVSDSGVKMMDPGSKATDLWKQYDWNRTSRIDCFKKS